MPRTLVIRFPDQTDDAIGHRAKNFAEDVWRQVRANGWGAVDIADVDTQPTTHFTVADVKASNVRRVRAWVEREAARQNLSATVDVLAE